MGEGEGEGVGGGKGQRERCVISITGRIVRHMGGSNTSTWCTRAHSARPDAVWSDPPREGRSGKSAAQPHHHWPITASPTRLASWGCQVAPAFENEATQACASATCARASAGEPLATLPISLPFPAVHTYLLSLPRRSVTRS